VSRFQTYWYVRPPSKFKKVLHLILKIPIQLLRQLTTYLYHCDLHTYRCILLQLRCFLQQLYPSSYSASIYPLRSSSDLRKCWLMLSNVSWLDPSITSQYNRLWPNFQGGFCLCVSAFCRETSAAEIENLLLVFCSSVEELAIGVNYDALWNDLSSNARPLHNRDWTHSWSTMFCHQLLW
jgi:hypothetical protein